LTFENLYSDCSSVEAVREAASKAALETNERRRQFNKTNRDASEASSAGNSSEAYRREPGSAARPASPAADSRQHPLGVAGYFDGH
jgi:hypothetical protein